MELHFLNNPIILQQMCNKTNSTEISHFLQEQSLFSIINRLSTKSRKSVVSKNLLGFKSSSPTSHRFTANNLLGLGFDRKLNNTLAQTRNYSVNPTHIAEFTTAPSIEYLGYLTKFFGKFESIPFTKQTLVVFPFFDKMFRVLGVDDFRREVLPHTHLHCVRVKAIARKLLKALEREDGKYHSLVGEEWPEECNLDYRNWKIVVWEHPQVHAWFTNTGKLIVASNLCDFYKTDAEVAFSILQNILYYLVKYGKFPRSDYELRYEQEADYIGMFLSASAGYDPRVAPVVLRDKIGDGAPSSFLEKRIKLLSQPKVMQEAVSIYQESIKGQGTD